MPRESYKQHLPSIGEGYHTQALSLENPPAISNVYAPPSATCRRRCKEDRCTPQVNASFPFEASNSY